MPFSKPLTPEAATEPIHPSVVTSAKTPAATARTRLFIRMALPQRSKTDELIGSVWTVNAEGTLKVVQNANSAMVQLTER